MRPTDSPSGAGQADQLTFFNALTGFHLDLAEMGVNRKYLRSVIDDDGVSGVKQILGYPDHSAVGRADRCAHRRPKIQTVVKTFELTVKYPPVAEGAGYVIFNRQ